MVSPYWCIRLVKEKQTEAVQHWEVEEYDRFRNTCVRPFKG